MRKLLCKINSLSPFSTLFLILIFFLPFQKGYEKPLKFLFRGAHFSIYLSDFLILILFISAISTISLRKASKYLVAFLFICFISICHSSDGNIFNAYHSWLAILFPAALFFIISSHLDIQELLIKSFWVFLLAALMESTIAIVQYLQQAPLGLKYFGEPLFFPAFGTQTNTRWLLDSFFGWTLPTKILIRASGTFPHSNILGTFMTASILLLFYLYTTLREVKKKALLLSALFILEFVLFISYSRAALYGLALSSFLWFGFAFWKKSGVKILFAAFFTSTLLCCILLYPQLSARGGIFNYNKVAKGSDEARLTYQKTSLEISKNDRLLGVGWQRCFSSQEGAIDVHNIYLMVGSATGILGLIFYLGFIASTLYHTLKQKQNLLSMTLLSIFLFLLWIGCCDYLLIKSVHGRLLFFLFPALLLAYAGHLQVRVSSITPNKNIFIHKKSH